MFEGELLTEHQLSNLYGIPEKTLRQDRYRGKGLPFYKVGRRVYYRQQDIETFLASVRVEPKGNGR